MPWYRRCYLHIGDLGGHLPHGQVPGEGFHAQVARWLTGRLTHMTPDKIHTLAAKAQEKAGFLTMEEYIRQHKNTFAQYIATQSLLYLCVCSKSFFFCENIVKKNRLMRRIMRKPLELKLGC